jgi:hypothetical protein
MVAGMGSTPGRRPMSEMEQGRKKGTLAQQLESEARTREGSTNSAWRGANGDDRVGVQGRAGGVTS